MRNDSPASGADLDLSVWVRVLQLGDTDPTFTPSTVYANGGADRGISARIIAFRGVDTTYLFSGHVRTSIGAAATTWYAETDHVSDIYSWVVAIAATSDDNDTALASLWSDNEGWTGQDTYSTTTGDDHSVGWATFEVSAPDTVPQRPKFEQQSHGPDVWVGMTFSLKPNTNIPASHLVDPMNVDGGWVPWLAQLVSIPGITVADASSASATWGYLYSYVDVDTDGIPEWWEWQGSSAPGNPATASWETLMNSNLAQRSQLTPVRQLIRRRQTHGFREGSTDAIRHVVQSVLGGSKWCMVGKYADLSPVISELGGYTPVAEEWAVIHIVTKTAETPSSQAVLDAAEVQRPAGFVFEHTQTA